MKTRELTVKDYYKHFASIFGGIAAFISSLPLISVLMPADYSRYLFPPLGTIEPFGKVGALVLTVLITIIAYYSQESTLVSKRERRFKLLLGILAVAVIGFFVFIGLNQRFVRSVPVPSINQTAEFVVSVGYERTEFAQGVFGQQSDWDILRQRGVTEEEIFRLWTPTSVIIARLALLISYIAFLLAAVAACSLAVLFDKLDS
jgi:hypothetical protein